MTFRPEMSRMKTPPSTKKALEGVQDSLKQAPARVIGYRAHTVEDEKESTAARVIGYRILTVKDEKVSTLENSSRSHSVKQFAQVVMLSFGKECNLHIRENRQTKSASSLPLFKPGIPSSNDRTLFMNSHINHENES